MIVVAGVGNLLLGDDGFGPAVIEELRAGDLGVDVLLVDAGIRTMHLAYDLADGVDLFIAIDTIRSDDPPGTVLLLDPDFDAPPSAPQGHGMDLHQVWALAHRLGPGPRRARLVACVPDSLEERLGLSPTVRSAVPVAATVVMDQIEEARVG